MNDSANPEAPKIEFPCDYPVKVIGRCCDEFQDVVLGVFETHAPGFDRERVVLKNSSKGTFNALTVTIIATGEPQLQALFEDLKTTGLVSMVM